jgi:hypothetical protein
MKKYAKPLALHVVLPLFCGGLIYLLFRQDTFLHKIIFRAYHQSFIRWDNWLTYFIAYNLPDFCWSYSLASVLFIWEKWQEKMIKLFPFYIFLILLSAETIQLFLPGSFRFDWLDIVAALLGFLLSYYEFHFYEKK